MFTVDRKDILTGSVRLNSSELHTGRNDPRGCTHPSPYRRFSLISNYLWMTPGMDTIQNKILYTEGTRTVGVFLFLLSEYTFIWGETSGSFPLPKTALVYRGA